LQAAISNLDNFTIQTYTSFLLFLKRRYEIIPFCRFSRRNRSFLVLRHDVHASLDAALQMAEIEKKLGIAATYTVFLFNRFYNLSNRDDLALLLRIAKMGHEIGLHYDIEEYSNFRRPLQETLLMEIKMLERLVRRKLRTIAMHNPSSYKFDPFAHIPRYTNAYTFNKAHDVFYVSDSCRAWRIADIHNLIANKPERVQLLIHPFHWIPSSQDRYSSLDRLFERIDKQNREYKRQWKETWKRLPHVTRYDKEIRTSSRLLDFG